MRSRYRQFLRDGSSRQGFSHGESEAKPLQFPGNVAMEGFAVHTIDENAETASNLFFHLPNEVRSFLRVIRRGSNPDPYVTDRSKGSDRRVLALFHQISDLKADRTLSQATGTEHPVPDHLAVNAESPPEIRDDGIFDQVLHLGGNTRNRNGHPVRTLH